MDDEIVRIIDLPGRVGAMTVLDADGNYNIYINARLSYADRLAAYRHELAHTRGVHFYSKEKNLAECEAEAQRSAL